MCGRSESTTRRAFLKSGFALGSALLGTSPRGSIASPASLGNAPARKSRLVIARDPNLQKGGASLDSSRLLKLLDRAMQASYDCDSPTEAWKKIMRPGEVIGLKVIIVQNGTNFRDQIYFMQLSTRKRKKRFSQILIAVLREYGDARKKHIMKMKKII